MYKIAQRVSLVILLVAFTFPVYAQNRHEMCYFAELTIKIISQKLGDTEELTAQKSSSVHVQCFNAPLSEVQETYRYLIENWDSIFDKKN